MNRPRLTVPLIPEAVDLRRRHQLTEGRADAGLFEGWGIRLPVNLPW